MPGGDGTGPLGLGPRTGRGMGFCSGFGRPGYANAGFGRRFFMPRFWRGFGFGRGFGWRWSNWWNYPAETTGSQQNYANEREYLENELRLLEENQGNLSREIESIKKRLNELNQSS